MAQLTCSRCGSTAEALEKAPLPGEVGQLVQARTCPNCWTEWLETQVKLINEHKLSPADPEHYAFLLEQMKGFLGLV